MPRFCPGTLAPADSRRSPDQAGKPVVARLQPPPFSHRQSEQLARWEAERWSELIAERPTLVQRRRMAVLLPPGGGSAGSGDSSLGGRGPTLGVVRIPKTPTGPVDPTNTSTNTTGCTGGHTYNMRTGEEIDCAKNHDTAQNDTDGDYTDW